MIRKAVFAGLLSWIIISVLTVPAFAEENKTETKKAAWTIMFYICGADLESKHGYGTENLDEIIGCYPMAADMHPTIAENDDDGGSPTNVNIVIETGGTEKWNPKQTETPVTPDASKLQRWYYGPAEDPEAASFYECSLVQDLPLESMASAETLSDFIRWGAETYPAEKYGLVLWGHGGGSRTGLFIDENFDRDIMHLDELKRAMDNCGTHLEMILFEACMMANVETAWAVREQVSWMVASEETLPGKGSNLREWLLFLYDNPWCDGRQLGRYICDSTYEMYGEEDRQCALSSTWSVIDLSCVDQLVSDLNLLFREVGSYYQGDTSDLFLFMKSFLKAEEYGLGTEHMKDLGNILLDYNVQITISREMREALMNDLDNTVVYCLKGSDRTSSRGLSICLATSLGKEDLDIYADNCPFPAYLAFLDAVTNWDAPETVYEKEERLPAISTIEEYNPVLEKAVEDGQPVIKMEKQLNGEEFWTIANVFYRMYKEDETNEQMIFLGRHIATDTSPLDENMDVEFCRWSITDPGMWQGIDGELCCMDMSVTLSNGGEYIYRIPILTNGELWYMRCEREYAMIPELRSFYDEGEYDHSSEYTVLDLQEGYDHSNSFPTRNVKEAPQMAGQEYCLVYPVDENGYYRLDKLSLGKTMTMYKRPLIEDIPLPAGDYYLAFEIEDMFGRAVTTDKVKMNWDGNVLSMAEGESWEGTVDFIYSEK